MSSVDYPKHDPSTSSQSNQIRAPKRTQAMANAELLQELSSKYGQVKHFSIDDSEYPSQTVYCIPFKGNSSDEMIQEMIEMVVYDGVPLAGTTMRMVGFDIEWCHDFKLKKERPISLIQICGKSITLIIQLVHLQAPSWFNHIMPTPIAEFLRNDSIVKFGVGITGDASKILKDQFSDRLNLKVYLNAYLEMKDLANLLDPNLNSQSNLKQTLSLQTFVAKYLHQYFPKIKHLTLSNWEAFYLTPAQITYAASDVISAMRIYLKLYEMPTYHPEVIPPIKYANLNNI